jgi:1-acyl-sn-glycerol-3-phosphate acyltransferase
VSEVAPAYQVPLFSRIIRPLAKPIFQGIFHILANIRISGQENVPRRKPYIVTMNHISLFDPPFVLAFWPEMLEAMGASDLWERPGQKYLVRMYHAIQVHRGEFDREVFDKVFSVLAANRPLLLAPEGGRSHQLGMNRAKPGVSFIAEKVNAPIVPVGVIGTTDDFFQRAKRGERPTLELHIGKPFTLPPAQGKGGDERREARQRNADFVMERIAELLPVEYRGYYKYVDGQ